MLPKFFFTISPNYTLATKTLDLTVNFKLLMLAEYKRLLSIAMSLSSCFVPRYNVENAAIKGKFLALRLSQYLLHISSRAAGFNRGERTSAHCRRFVKFSLLTTK